jgi:hypothetical protein
LKNNSITSNYMEKWDEHATIRHQKLKIREERGQMTTMDPE